MPDLMTRRQLLLAIVLLPAARLYAATNSLPSTVMPNEGNAVISWSEFRQRMTLLAEAHAGGEVSQSSLSGFGLEYLKRLDTDASEFEQAVAEAFESGNRYWLWQRLVKSRNLNGGILSIQREQPVQLHDHPGATGMLRILDGEAEVWQFDEVSTGNNERIERLMADTSMTGRMGDSLQQPNVELVRLSYQVLKPGDTAVLTPDRGNIHALRAITAQCRMLDFFIPPYDRSQRSWYEPQQQDWFNRKKLVCRRVPQHAYQEV